MDRRCLITLTLTIGLYLTDWCIVRADGYRLILPITTPFNSPSHFKLLATITRDLVGRGHHVTLLTSTGKGVDASFSNDSFSDVIVYQGCFTKEEISLHNERMIHTFIDGNSFSDMATNMQEMAQYFYECCADLWKDEAVIKELKDNHYDLLIVFYLSPCGGLIPHYFDIPFITVTSSVRLPGFHEGTLGMPLPSSYVPFDIFGSYSDRMTFMERLQNLVIYYTTDLVNIYFTRSFQNLQHQLNIKPERRPDHLLSDSEILLSHIDLTIDYARPFTPNVIPIGGILVVPNKQLRAELEEFVMGSGEHGVIICSMGSAVKSLNIEIILAMAQTFNEVKQRVIWKFDGEIIPSIRLKEHILLVKWLPQNDLLGHPKTRLMVYHGGINGVYEAIYHAVPMILIPLFADQTFIAARVNDKGMGITLDKTSVTSENFGRAINTVLTDLSFQTTINGFSAIFRDMNNVQTPLQRATYWIEHVLKFGSGHLRPRSADMSSIELYMLDVIVFFLLLSLVLLFVIYIIVNRCISCFKYCHKNSTSSKRLRRKVD